MIEGIRNPQCTDCKLHQTADVVCQIGMGPPKAEIMIVSKMANSVDWQRELENELTEVGVDTSNIYYTQAIKCRTFDQNASNADVKQCKKYLDAEIAAVDPKYILAFGNEPLLATVGRSGITKYRGQFFERPPSDAVVLPTISPSAVKRNPGQRPGFVADLRLFANRVHGVVGGIAKPEYAVIDTKKKLKALKKILSWTTEIGLDVETHGEYYKSDGRIISLSATCELRKPDGTKGRFAFALPLYHPESPWKRMHRSVLLSLKEELEAIPKLFAHNAPYDFKWLIQYGIMVLPTFDTMTAIHVLDENVQKGLKPQAQARLGVEPWGIDTRYLLSKPLDEILEYNVLDTWYMYHMKKQLVQELKERPRQARLLMKLLMPGQRELIRSEMRGIWIDVPRLTERTPIVEKTLAEIEQKIIDAAELPEYGSELWPVDAKGRPREINFNASIFARWMLFEWCELPVITRGKEKPDGRPGDPSMSEDVLLELQETTGHPVIKAMLERVQWQKWLSGFLRPWAELYDEDHRIHTNFKITGTVTGRLSSGKSDADKVSVGKGKLRGVNLQQVPRDPFMRGIFGAPPGWTFVEADYSQIELRIAAFVAREPTMMHIYSIGGDIHLTTAAKVTGLPESQVTKKVRKEVGKPVNFGFLYGMGWRKFIQTAFSNYGVRFNEDEAQGYRRGYFDLYSKLLPWHARQRRLVNEYGRVQSPLGRIRHLPDIYSPDQGVRAEAERQAINSPVQGFASDLAVLSMVMINQQFRDKGIQAHCLGLVHDAINYEVRDDHVAQALPIIKDTMEDMSIVRKKFGVVIDIPIIADLGVGRHWGDKLELTPDQVYDWKREYGGE